MRHLITSLALLTLAACGGGGGGSSSNTLSGTAATGAPMAGASIEVYNSSGIKVATATADSSGKYTSSALLGEGPYVIKATSGTTELYSVQSSADGSVVNVTPLSNLVATLLSPTGNAANLVDEFGADKTLLSSTGINDKKAIVKSIAAPVATAIGLDPNFDVINTAMVANGTGLDQVLDTVSIGITHEAPSSSSSSQLSSSSISVTYKMANSADSEPQIITFNSSDIRSTVIASVNGVRYTSADVYDSSLMTKVLVWVNRNNECNKVPPTQRWTGSTGSKVFTAEICKKLFFNNDQSTFKVNGLNTEQVWAQSFSNKTWTSDALSEPEYVYSTSDGEVMVKAKAILFNDDDTTYTRYYFFNLNPDPNNNNELRAKGNGYNYETTANSINYIRYFPYSSGYDYTFSGYEFDIPTTGTRGDSSIAPTSYAKTVKSAVVTTPSGGKTYLKNTGLAQLVACTNSAMTNCSESSRKIFQSTFLNTPTDQLNLSRTRPAEYSSSGFVDYGPTEGQLIDSEIKKLPIMGTYKFELTLSDNSVVTQRVPFFGRPKTHREILQARTTGFFPTLTSTSLTGLFRGIISNVSQFQVWPVKLNSSLSGLEPTAFDFAWTNLAQFIYMSGWQNYQQFELRKNVTTADRTKTISCFKYGSVDPCYNNTSEFNWGQSGSNIYAVFYYMEIGNYFSDFGVNTSAYGFWEVATDGRNTVTP